MELRYANIIQDCTLLTSRIKQSECVAGGSLVATGLLALMSLYALAFNIATCSEGTVN